jgi:D-glycero-D-manno-heptose 1,7-bisphosphate phosphatase
VEAGHRAGCRSVLLDVGNETEWVSGPLREPDLRCTDLLDAAQATLDEGLPWRRPQQPLSAGVST